MPKRSWVSWLQDLHFDLLGGETGGSSTGSRPSRLVLMFATGLVVWWPGIDRWRRSLSVDFRKSWKRINWELHGAIGFWLFALLMLWAVTGVEFAFPRQFRRAVNAVAPLSVMRTPESSPRAGGKLPEAETTALIAKAQEIVPGAKMGRVVLPSTNRAPILLLMALSRSRGLRHERRSVALLRPVHRAVARTAGSGAREAERRGSVMKWLGPLHIGSFGGIGVKVLWAVLALSFPGAGRHGRPDVVVSRRPYVVPGDS